MYELIAGLEGWEIKGWVEPWSPRQMASVPACSQLRPQSEWRHTELGLDTTGLAHC
jgi:hypothetical protein